MGQTERTSFLTQGDAHISDKMRQQSGSQVEALLGDFQLRWEEER
jgi:hypothetical protein